MRLTKPTRSSCHLPNVLAMYVGSLTCAVCEPFPYDPRACLYAQLVVCGTGASPGSDLSSLTFLQGEREIRVTEANLPSAAAW